MFNFEQFKELLPKTLQCKKVSEYEEIIKYLHNTFYGYDENNQVYTISKDKNGILHVLERNFAEEKKAKYEALNRIGEGMTLFDDPSFVVSHKQPANVASNICKREIILTPSRDKTRKGYTNITIKLDNKTYSIIYSNGDVQLLEGEETLQTSLDERKEILSTLKRPFEISLIDRIKIKNIPNTDNDRLHHIEKTNQVKSVFVPITPERMREWDEAEK